MQRVNILLHEGSLLTSLLGFDTSFKPAFPIVGRNNVDLATKWAVAPEAYLGLGWHPLSSLGVYDY